MPNIGQLTYSLFPPQAEPGQLGDNTVNRIRSYGAAEAINPGRMLQLASDGVSCQQVQNTTAASSTTPPTKRLGFAVLLTAREGVGAVGFTLNSLGQGSVFQAGDMVPVLQRGSIFAEWKGTTQVGEVTPNVYHSSTTATDRGKITDAATSNTAGSEVSVAGNGVKILPPALAGTGNIVLLEVNLPGDSST